MLADKKIIVVDDDFEDRIIITECFKELGLTDAVMFITDGLLLLEYLSTSSSANVSLIVLDLNMPKMNGTETLRALKANTLLSNIPVVIFSTSINEIEKEQCLQLGARDYKTKPSEWAAYVNTCKDLYELAGEPIS